MKASGSLSVNPIKVAPGLGAAFAVQGFQKAMAFFHSAPGCAFLGKVLLTQHFMEPVAAMGSDIKETALVFGGTRELEVAVTKFCQKSQPEIVFIISSSIPEIRGEIYGECLQNLSKSFPAIRFVVVSAPDFNGGFSEGFAHLVVAAIENLVSEKSAEGRKIANQINILPAPYMTVGDIDELRTYLAGFGFEALVIADISSGPDGSKEKFSSMSVSGTSLEMLQNAGNSVATISFGGIMYRAGELLGEKTSGLHFNISNPYGLIASDKLSAFLIQLADASGLGTKIAHYIQRDRARLKDMMIDTHLILNNKNVAVALDYDHAAAFLSFFRELGINSESAYAPTIRDNTANTTSSENGGILPGTLFDIEQQLEEGAQIDALIANSHGRELSQKFAVPLIRAGFPVTDRYGYNYETFVGYRGAISMIGKLANSFMEAARNHSQIAPGAESSEEMQQDYMKHYTLPEQGRD